MMKTYKYIALAVLALGMAACSQEDDFAPQGNQKDAPLAIASAGVAELSTRATITSQDGKDYLTGGSIGVFVTSATGGRYAGSNVKWTYSNSQWGLDDATVVLYEANGTNQQIGVCYPYMEAVDGKYAIELPDAFDSNYENYDYLYANYTALGSNPATIGMNHLLSKVTVSVTTVGTEIGDDAVQSISLFDVPRTASWKVPSSTLSSFGKADQVTKLYANDTNNDNTTDNYVGYALPNGATNLAVRVTMNSRRSFAAQVPINGGLASGNHYLIGLKVGKDVVTVSSVSVESWGTGGSIDNEDTEAKEVKVTVTTSDNTATLTIPELATDAMVQKVMNEFDADGITTITANGNLSDAMHAAIISAISKKNTQGAVTNGKLSESSVTYTVHPDFTDALTTWIGTDGATLTLLADTPECTDNIVIVGKTLTLDLNGHALNGSSDNYIHIQVGDADTNTEGGLTICDSGTGGAVNMNRLDIRAGSVNLQGGTLNHWVENKGTFNMTGGKVGISSAQAIRSSGTLNISGGEVSGWSGINASNGSVNISGSPVITGTDFNGNGGAAISVGSDSATVIISGTPTLTGGSYGDIAAYYPVTLNTQPTTGTWCIYTTERMITKNNGLHVFAKPGEGIELDATKFESLVDGYEVQQQDDGSLALVQVATEGE